MIWVLGLLTFVPYGIYYLLFLAERQEYALWIVGVLFWIFGYWSVVGPLLSLLKVRGLMKTFETVRSKEDLKKLVNQSDSPSDNEDAIIDFIAKENRLPYFVAKLFYHKLLKRVVDTKL